MMSAGKYYKSLTGESVGELLFLYLTRISPGNVYLKIFGTAHFH